MMVPTQLGVIPLYMHDGQARLDRQPAGGDPAVLVTRVRRLLHAPVPRRRRVPDELIEAARVDGASHAAHLLERRAARRLRPAAAVLGLFTFMLTWNDFFWPLIVLDAGQPDRAGRAASSWPAATTPTTRSSSPARCSATLPLLVVFVLLGRQIVGGIMEGAVKG